jgi:hypothetical protein
MSGRVTIDTSQHPLGRRNPAGVVDADRVAQGTRQALERRFDDVVHVAARTSSTCRVMLAAVANEATACSANWGRTRDCPTAATPASGRATRPTAAPTGRGRRRSTPRRADSDRWRNGAHPPCRRARRRMPRRERSRRLRPCGACRCGDHPSPACAGRSRRDDRSGRACGRRRGCRSRCPSSRCRRGRCRSRSRSPWCAVASADPPSRWVGSVGRSSGVMASLRSGRAPAHRPVR